MTLLAVLAQLLDPAAPTTSPKARERARSAAFAAEGFGMPPDADGVSDADLRAFEAFARARIEEARP